MPSEIDLQIEAFLRAAPARLAAHSVNAYREDLALWQRFFASEQLHALAQIRVPALRLFLIRERQRGVSVPSLRRRFSALRSFYRWLRLQDPQVEDPSRGLPMPKGEQHFPDWLGVAGGAMPQAMRVQVLSQALAPSLIDQILYATHPQGTPLAVEEQGRLLAF